MNHILLSKYSEVFCQTCGAEPGKPCVTAKGEVYKTGFVHNTRKLSLRRANATGKAAMPQNFRMVHCPHCGAKPGQPCHTKNGTEAITRESHKPRRRRFREAVNFLIAAAEVTPDRMAAGNAKKYTRVIMNGEVYEWRDGWYRLGPPLISDDLLPRVIEPTFSVMVTRHPQARFAEATK